MWNVVVAVGVIASLASCDQGAKKITPPPPRDAAAPGIIRGVVTFTMNGPGAEHTPDESFSDTSPLHCTVAVTDARGTRTDVSTTEKGEYELKVQPGRYTVSFEACTDSYCDGPEGKKKSVDVAASATADASFNCQVYAK